MSVNFFEKLILRARGRLPVVVPKLETMLTPGRRVGTMPELALSGAPQPSPPLAAAAPPPAAQLPGKDGGDDGKGGTGGGTEGGAGGGGGALGPPPGDLPAGARARAAGVHRATVSPVEISIGKLEIHAAPVGPRPAPVRRSAPLPVHLDRRR